MVSRVIVATSSPDEIKAIEVLGREGVRGSRLQDVANKQRPTRKSLDLNSIKRRHLGLRIRFNDIGITNQLDGLITR